MKFFVEEKHTNKEWVWVMKHRIIFYTLMIIWFLVLYFIILVIVLLMQNIIVNQGFRVLIGILFFTFGYFGLAQLLLTKFWDMTKVFWKAKWNGKIIIREFKDGNQIIKIVK